MPKFFAEAGLLVLCSAIATALVGGAVWMARRRHTRGRRSRRKAVRRAIRRWATPRRIGWSTAGLLLVAATGWWGVDWLRHEPPTQESIELAAVAGDHLEVAEVVAFGTAVDPAAREKMVEERWHRGLPLLAVIGLLVVVWVALAHSGLLDQRQRGRAISAQTQRRS